MNYLTIDGGTTNTRISLVKDYKIVDTIKFNIGSQGGCENKKLLKATVKDGIKSILLKNSMCQKDIKCIIASGMITSDYGLYKLDHTIAPAGIKELHNAMEELNIFEISDIPFVFIRGVKTDCADLESTDIMRGEETELMGIGNNGECVYILPGSHSKIIYTDQYGRICNFTTTLSGEMIAALSKNTILKNSVSLEHTDTDAEYLIKGYEYCLDKGINEALFKTRILDTVFNKDSSRLYSFFMGVVLCGEIKEIIKKAPAKIIIGGKKQIARAMYTILNANSNIETVCLTDEQIDSSVPLGAVKIYEYNG